MEPILEQVSHIFFLSNTLNFFQKVHQNSYQKSMDSKYLEWEGQNMNWNLTIRANQLMKKKSDKYWEEGQEINQVKC
jgi:hypothetical protein